MAAASAANAPKAASRARAPHVNCFDIPELMPGAQPSANPAQKEEFQQRCRKLHRDEETDKREAAETATVMRAAAGAAASASDLEAMFPMLDASLVRSLFAEAPTPQHAIETLLALSAACSEPVAGGEEARPASPPPRNLGVEDHEKFPTLVDGGGWQVVSQKQLEKDEEEELGSAWRDRAKAARDIPAPRPAPSYAAQAAATASQARRKQKGPKEDQEAEQDYPTDYDFRHSAGQRRAQHKVQYGRGGRAAAAKSGRGAAHGGRASADASSSEEEPEMGGGGGLPEQGDAEEAEDAGQQRPGRRGGAWGR